MPADVVITSSLSDSEVLKSLDRIEKRIELSSSRTVAKNASVGGSFSLMSGRMLGVLGVATALVAMYHKMNAATDEYEKRNWQAALSLRGLREEQLRLENAWGRFLAHPAITGIKSAVVTGATDLLNMGYGWVAGRDAVQKSYQDEEDNRRQQRLMNAASVGIPMQAEIFRNAGYVAHSARLMAKWTKIQAEEDIGKRYLAGDIDKEQKMHLTGLAGARYRSELFAIQRENSTAVGGGIPVEMAKAALGNAPTEQEKIAGDVARIGDLLQQMLERNGLMEEQRDYGLTP